MNRLTTALWLALCVTGISAAALADNASALQPARDALERLRNSSTPVNADQAGAMVPLFDEALRAEPNSADWSIGRALALRTSGNAEAALASLKAFVKANPKQVEARYELGQTWMATISSDMGILSMADRAGSAKDEWEEAVKIDPNHVRARYSAAMYWIQARKQGGWLFGSYDKAEAHGEALLKIPGGRGEFAGHMVLGTLAAAKEEWDDMSRHFLAAETAQGELADPMNAMTQHAMELVRSKEDGSAALPVLVRLAELRPESVTVMFLTGEAYRLQNDCASATVKYEAVLAANPDARNSRFRLAECYAKIGRNADAVREYDEFVARFPKDDLASKAQSAAKKLRKSR